jgi:hypothetical protein
MLEQTPRTVEIVTLEIKTMQKQAQQIVLGYAIEIGRRLVEAKGLIPHGGWGEYLKNEVEYSQSTANNLMRIFEEFGAAQIGFLGGESNSQSLGNLPYTKALLLLALPGEEREEFAESVGAAELTTRELKDAIRERDAARKWANDLGGKLGEAKNNLANERRKKRELETELKELRSRPIEVAVETVTDEDAIAAARKEAAQEAREEAEKTLLGRIEQATLRAAELEKKLKLTGNDTVAVFKVRFETAQEQLNRLMDALAAVRESGDEEMAAKLTGAVSALLTGILEVLR